MYRRDGQRRVSEQESALAYLLYPHLAGALATRSALATLSNHRALDDAHAHAFVAYPAQKVELSKRAKQLLATDLAPVGRAGWNRVERMILRAAHAFCRGELGARSRVLVRGIRVEWAWLPARRNESHRIVALFFRERQADREISAPIAELLSPKQQDVAQLAANGATNPQIAARLQMSVATVRTHLRAIFERLDVTRRSELAAVLYAE
jgi:DNA-binding CsgD family transcriptional regulator